MFRIINIKLRRILNSNADWAVEAEVFLEDGSQGRGSSPAAVIPGKRERTVTDKQTLRKLDEIEAELRRKFIEEDFDQHRLDAALSALLEEIGSDISLAVSLAFARAASNSMKVEYVTYLSGFLKGDLHVAVPNILVPVFSGGVHSEQRDSFQQIMACIKEGRVEERYSISKKISCIAEEVLEKRQINIRVAASGGYVADSLNSVEQLELMQEILAVADCDKSVGVAIDVAAEHLHLGTGYLFDRKLRTRDEFLEIIRYCINQFQLCYIEDPFITEDSAYWEKLKKNCKGGVQIIGDDLFATQSTNIEPAVAHGVVVKMNQAGNLSDTFAAIKKARENKMAICVSHRSYETEDTAMCDLAIAAAADYIKIGSVRRGERIIKYNQLLRLEELVE